MMLSRATLNRIAELPAYLLPPPAARWTAARLYTLCYRLFETQTLKLTETTVRLTLAEPRQQARAITQACFAAKGAQRSNYRSMARRKDWRIAHNEFSPTVHRALADTTQPLVILTLHQADYLAGLLAVLKLIPTSREIHIIKLAEWTSIEELAYRHFRRYGHTLVIHRLSEKPAKKIVRALKRKAILATFVDVPREFGATEPVTLFGLPFRLTSGPLAMAKLAGARVLPVFSHYSQEGFCEIEAGNFIHSKPQHSGSKPRLPDMAQQLANQIEDNLRSYAHQWEMWPVLPNLLDQEVLANHPPDMHPSTLVRLAIASKGSE